jgi:hypothetical protein
MEVSFLNRPEESGQPKIARKRKEKPWRAFAPFGVK